jgi:nanoRNase/pAp phosphatase (c-di-AMP/oligoRNAs hydrolase)
MANDVFQQAVDLINKSERVLITTHTRPDGDACGCVAAITDALLALNKKARPLMLSTVPEWYEFLFPEPVPVLGEDIKLEELVDGQFGTFDLIIIVDTNSNSQLPEFEKYLKQIDIPVLVIDHHVTSDNLGDVEINDTKAAAAGLIIHDLFEYAGWPVTAKIAEALFMAITTDTGWFQFSNTDSRTLRTCAGLVDAGVSPTQIYAGLYQNFSVPRFKLMTAMLISLEMHFDNRYACVHLRRNDFESTGAKYSDTENLINECSRIGTLEVSAIFIELKDKRIRCSLRSGGNVDVSQIAAGFGGGGHKMAAGTFLPGPLENAKKLILDEISKKLK